MVPITLQCKNWSHLSTGGKSSKGKSLGQGSNSIFKERHHVQGRQYCLRKTASSRSSMTSAFSRSITRQKKIFTRLILHYIKQLFLLGRAKNQCKMHTFISSCSTSMERKCLSQSCTSFIC